MQPPIIASNFGDVLIFENAEIAVRYLEPIDVRNDEYTVYDGEGRLLKAAITQVGSGRERVVLEDFETEPRHQSELRKVLVEFLAAVGESQETLELCSLDQLVEKGLRFKTK